MRLELALVVGFVLAASPDAFAARIPRPDPPEREARHELPKNAGLERTVPADAPPSRTERAVLQPSEFIDASEALDEMIDELVADLTRLGPAKLSPVLLDRARVSDNMNPNFATVLEGRIATALVHAGGINATRCAECWATHGRVENGTYIVTRGINSGDDLERLFTRYGAKSLLTASLTMENRPVDSLALDVEIVNETGSILYAESMRVSGRNAMLYRAVDTSQIRQARLDELERKLNMRPVWGYSLSFGAMMLPVSGDPSTGSYWGASSSLNFYERFGDERQYRFGLGIGGFIHGGDFAAGLVSMTLLTRTHPENVNRPSFHIGPTAGALLALGAGNTAFLGVQAEYILAVRFALQGSLTYVLPFTYGNGNASISGSNREFGGLTPQIGAGLIW